MNKRIRELAEQAGFYVADDKIYTPTTSEEITDCQIKFAELIVQECIDIVGEYSEDGAYCQRQMIKERFGVE